MKNKSGLGIVAFAVILIGIAAAGWFMMKDGSNLDQTSPDIMGETAEPVSPPNVSETMQDADTAPATPVIPDTAGGNQPVPSVSEEMAPAVATKGAVREDGTVDVEAAMSPRTMGNPNAPIKIIEYASLTCSHCAHFHNDVLPQMKEKYIDTGKVFMEFREFPLNDPALKATLTARCLPKERYDGFISLLFKTQDSWAAGMNYMAALEQNAKLAGMSEESFDACQGSRELQLALADSMQQGKDQYMINATPTFIINDGAQKIEGAQPLTEFERVFRIVSNNAIGAATVTPREEAPAAAEGEAAPDAEAGVPSDAPSDESLAAPEAAPAPEEETVPAE